MRRLKCAAGRALALILLCNLAAGCGQTDGDLVLSGREQLEAGSYEEAVEAYTAQLDRGTNHEDDYRGLGIAYMGLGEYEKAAGAFETALTQAGVVPHAKEFDINYYLGSCYYKLGRYEDALKVFEAILTLHPKDPQALQMRGAVKAALGDMQGMQADFTRAIAAKQTDYDRMISIYEIMEEYGMAEEGKDMLRNVLSRQERSIDDYNRGRLAYYVGDYQAAKAALESTRIKDDYNAAIYLGRTYEALGDYNYASSVYQAYLSRDDSHAELYNQLGLCCLKMGDYQAALSAFQTGKTVSGSQILQSLMFNEIVATEYLGDFQRAAVLVREYLAVYPGDEAAKREYEFLQTR